MGESTRESLIRGNHIKAPKAKDRKKRSRLNHHRVRANSPNSAAAVDRRVTEIQSAASSLKYSIRTKSCLPKTMDDNAARRIAAAPMAIFRICGVPGAMSLGGIKTMRARFTVSA